MRATAGLWLGVCVLALLVAARGQPDITEASYFWYGMDYGQAQSVLEDERDWEVLGELSTPSTSEIRCIWREEVLYIVRFYQGRCYHLEKRAEISAEAVNETFTYYLSTIEVDDDRGEYLDAMPAPDGGVQPVHNEDMSLLFCRWNLMSREIELTAQAHEDGSYMVFYEEFDPLVRSEAEHTRQQELQTTPQVVDPITGQPRAAPGQEHSGEGQEGEGQDEDEQEPPPPPPDDDDDDDWWY